MKRESEASLLTVYVNSTDQWHGRPLYAAIVQHCHDQGFAGATVYRAVEGYGVHRHIHTSRLLELTEDMPMRIEIVDQAGRIDALLTTLEPMIGEGLATVAPVHVVRFERNGGSTHPSAPKTGEQSS